MCNFCENIVTYFFILYPCNHRICKSCLYPQLHEELTLNAPITCPVCHHLVHKFFLPISNEDLVKNMEHYMYYYHSI